MGIEKHPKEHTKILTATLPWETALGVTEEEKKGAFICYFFHIHIIELFTTCVYHR